MKHRQEKLDQIREMMRNTPLPPELPQIFSFSNSMQYPLDFNMTSYHINLRNEKQDMQENVETIKLTIIAPL